MRTITISAALSAGLMAGQAMAADQWQWTKTNASDITSSTLRLEAIAGGSYFTEADLVLHTIDPTFVCRATRNGILHPGRLTNVKPWPNLL
jgi:hypothetical protein